MMATLTVELAQRGQITIPKALREQHKWNTGQRFSLIDLGGIVVMSPRESKIDTLTNQLRDDLLAEATTLEDMLAELRRPREAQGL
jgi:bifunctional DNA-binding transcriptional regulator/antitoxin component of YhaV-PrlF toxin-antitoxin module